MQKYVFLTISACVLACANVAGAGQIVNLPLNQGTAGSPGVTIEYPGANGTGAFAGPLYADPQVSSGTSNLFFSSTITQDYDALKSISGYQPEQPELAELWQVPHEGSDTLHENLVSIVPAGIHVDFVGVSAVPEPSSAVLGLMSVIAVGALTWWRRAK
jgi:hypothetical protein